MGKIEDKIKEDLLQTVFNDTFKIYEFIDNRFKLEEDMRIEVISKINALNDDLTKLLKEAKLS
jgi:hypothetical protein